MGMISKARGLNCGWFGSLWWGGVVVRCRLLPGARVGGRVLGGGELGAVSAPKGATVTSHGVRVLETYCSWGKRVDGAAWSFKISMRGRRPE